MFSFVSLTLLQLKLKYMELHTTGHSYRTEYTTEQKKNENREILLYN